MTVTTKVIPVSWSCHVVNLLALRTDQNFDLISFKFIDFEHLSNSKLLRQIILDEAIEHHMGTISSAFDYPILIFRVRNCSALKLICRQIL